MVWLMDINYCEECGTKLEKDSIFCPECGFKVNQGEIKTKFCSNCGEKISYNAEICPKCGVRLLNPLTNSAKDTVNKSFSKAGDLAKKYLTAKNIFIVFLIIVILFLITNAPAIIDELTPYKHVDSSYIANPVPGEKVQFDGVYVGSTSWSSGFYFYYSYITNNDVVKVGNEYVIIQGDYLSHNLYGHEGKTVHLEGRFAQGGKSKEPMDNKYIYGRWFGADTIELVN